MGGELDMLYATTYLTCERIKRRAAQSDPRAQWNAAVYAVRARDALTGREPGWVGRAAAMRARNHQSPRSVLQVAAGGGVY